MVNCWNILKAKRLQRSLKRQARMLENFWHDSFVLEMDNQQQSTVQVNVQRLSRKGVGSEGKLNRNAMQLKRLI